MNNDNYGKACGYTFVSDERAMESRRTIIRGCALVAIAVLSFAAFMSWRGYFAGWIGIGKSDAWKNVSGSYECFPFKVRDGKGFVYQGVNYDDPCEPVITRRDWTITRQGRTYVLYDVNPGDMKPNAFKDQFEESLWIGLLGDDGGIVRKLKLATGVKDISGVKRASGGAYVSATAVDGSKRLIALRFPRPWPELKTTGDVWKDFEMRMERRNDELWEDWPGNESGYAADWVSCRMETLLHDEYRKAIEVLKASAPNDACKAELASELTMAMAQAEKIVGDPSAEAGNVHWGNFYERVSLERTMEPYLRNWLEAAGNPKSWETVHSATGMIHGVSFAATSGVAVITVADDQVQLLRLSPANVMEADGGYSIHYEITEPLVMDSGYRVEQGILTIPK